LIIAWGKGTRLNRLTQSVVKPAVPFGCKYRIIDFTLSNCRNSGIDTVGILTQYKPLSLHSYLGNGSHWDLNHWNGGLTILPPYQQNTEGINWYEGTSHAVFQNIEFIEQNSPEYVLVLAADHIYKMDYRLMLEQHIKTKADCTVSVIEVPWEDANRFGVTKVGANKRIVAFEEKPENPISNLASMGIYIFTWSVLKEYLIIEEQKRHSSRDFAKDIIPAMLDDQLNLYAYHFNQYWKDVGTVECYWEANLDLLNREKNIFLQNPEWKIYTVDNNEPPIYIGKSAKIRESLVSEGCEIYGDVEKSVLFSGVKIGKGAIIKNSVILPHTIIEENVWIEDAVIGGQSRIKSGVIVRSVSPPKDAIVMGQDEARLLPSNTFYQKVM
jgi:glucose-1-phosphate adenylyltransferase